MNCWRTQTLKMRKAVQKNSLKMMCRNPWNQDQEEMFACQGNFVIILWMTLIPNSIIYLCSLTWLTLGPLTCGLNIVLNIVCEAILYSCILCYSSCSLGKGGVWQVCMSGCVHHAIQLYAHCVLMHLYVTFYSPSLYVLVTTSVCFCVYVMYCFTWDQ